MNILDFVDNMNEPDITQMSVDVMSNCCMHQDPLLLLLNDEWDQLHTTHDVRDYEDVVFSYNQDRKFNNGFQILETLRGI